MTSKVYFVVAGGFVKIGTSINIERRFAEFSTLSAAEFEVLGTVDGDHQLERAIHSHLHRHRHKGEWFTDCVAVRRVITAVLAEGGDAIGFSPTAKPELNWKRFSTEQAIIDLGLAIDEMGQKEFSDCLNFDHGLHGPSQRICDRLASNAETYLRLSAAIGFDPVARERFEPRKTGGLDRALLGIGMKIARRLASHTTRQAATACGTSSACISRIEMGRIVSIGSYLKACAYIGSHPFDYLHPYVARETSTETKTEAARATAAA